MKNKILFSLATILLPLLSITFVNGVAQLPTRVLTTNFEVLDAYNVTSFGSAMINGGAGLIDSIINTSQDNLKSAMSNDSVQAASLSASPGVPEFSPLALIFAVVGAGLGLVFLRKQQ